MPYIHPLSPQIAPSEKPSWIIVSEEGPSPPPNRHDTFESAQAESVRLAKLHPELEFGVFKYLGKTKATPTTKKVTKYAAWFNYFRYGHPTFSVDEHDKTVLHDTKEEALRSVECCSEPTGTVPFEIEVPADQKVT